MDSLSPVSQARARLNLHWLVRLRWAAVAGQLATIGIASGFMKMTLPLVPLLALVGVTAASNFLVDLWLGGSAQVSRKHSGALLALDTVLLTGLLYFSGGPFNPFSVFYLVHVTLAAAALGSVWVWGIVALSSVGFGSLFFWHRSIPGITDHAAHGGSYSLHVQGMWVAFTLAAALIAVFVGRLWDALQEQEIVLAEARERAARGERLASLATLAAGVAHELGSPLATIAVTSKELVHALEQEAGREDLRADAALIRAQVDRCRQILDAMGREGGQMVGEAVEPVLLPDVMESLSKALRERAARVTFARCEPVTLQAPRRTLEHVLVNLLRNSLDATAEGKRIELQARVDRGSILFCVEDEGAGMDAETLEHVTEPFFTTKEPGSGMGLGLFIAGRFAESMGGRLTIESQPGMGTQVTLKLPLKPAGGSAA